MQVTYTTSNMSDTSPQVAPPSYFYTQMGAYTLFVLGLGMLLMYLLVGHVKLVQKAVCTSTALSTGNAISAAIDKPPSAALSPETAQDILQMPVSTSGSVTV